MAYKSVFFEEDAPGGSSISRSIRENLNISPAGNPFDKFDRYHSVYPTDEMENLISYVFFVRPKICLLDPVRGLSKQAENDPVIKYIWKTSPECIHYLSRYSKYHHHFIPYFTGRVESIQVPDFQLKQHEIAQPFTGYKLPFAGPGIESTTAGTVNVTFRDDKYLRILNTHRVWTEYIHNVVFGLMDPILEGMLGPIAENRIDYAGSIYEILCRPDGHEIVWWNKYTGIFPTNLPDSNFSYNHGSSYENKVSIDYIYFHHRACDPVQLRDFMYNANVYSGRVIPNYVEDQANSGNGIVGTPVITRSKRGETFELHFME